MYNDLQSFNSGKIRNKTSSFCIEMQELIQIMSVMGRINISKYPLQSCGTRQTSAGYYALRHGSG